MNEENESEFNFTTYAGVFCLMCGQQYLTKTKRPCSPELCGPRCPSCGSKSYAHKDQIIDKPTENTQRYEGECCSIVDVVSEEDLLRKYKIQRDYSELGENNEN